MSNNTGMFFTFDWLGRWALDKAGVQEGSYSSSELRAMVDEGKVHPRSWVRHCWTGRFQLVGEVLYSNKKATEEEYAQWIPKGPHEFTPAAPPKVAPPRIV